MSDGNTYGIYFHPLRDIVCWILIAAGIAFGVCWFISCPIWILISLIVVMFVCLGLGLPRWLVWETRQRRAREAKKNEEDKWGFHSLERGGPWVNQIDYPLVKRTAYANNKLFYSEWLVIKDDYIMVNPGKPTVDRSNPNNKTVEYDFADQRIYAWDGCTPKRWFYWLFIVGTPDWWKKILHILIVKKDASTGDYMPDPKNVYWRQAFHASLVHDALYQYLDTIPIAKEDADTLFYDMLIDAGVLWIIAKVYHFGVRRFGSWDIGENDPQGNSDFHATYVP
jgi:hypothetical protein